jgi:hypothetical protein
MFFLGCNFRSLVEAIKVFLDGWKYEIAEVVCNDISTSSIVGIVECLLLKCEAVVIWLSYLVKRRYSAFRTETLWLQVVGFSDLKNDSLTIGRYCLNTGLPIPASSVFYQMHFAAL